MSDSARQHSGLLRALMSFAGPTLLSRVLGLVREMAIAQVFGVSAATDAFWVAFKIPNFFRRLFAEGSFSLAFVPVFTEVKQTQAQAELRELISRTAGTLGGVLLLLTALGMWFAPQVAAMFAPGSVGQPEKLGLIAEMLRITFPFLFFVSLTALCGGALNSFQRFALPAATPLILNVCMIVAAWWLAPMMDIPVMALAWSILVAWVLQLLIQFPALRSLNLLVWPRWGAAHSGVRRILRLMIPTLFGSSVAQINLLLDVVIASFLFEGSQTWLAQTDRLLEFPLGLFGVALGTVILPALSRHHVDTDAKGFTAALDWGLRMAVLIALPAMLGLMLLAEPVLYTLFQYGQFTPFDVQMAALSLVGLSFGLPAFVAVKVLAPAFYARQDTATPVKAGIASMIANMVFNVVFLAALYVLWPAPPAAEGLPWLQRVGQTPGLHLALAMASALSGYLNLFLLWRALRRRGDFQPQPGWGRHLGGLLLACAVMSLVLWLGLSWWSDFANQGFRMRALQLSVLIVAGITSFVAVLGALGMRPADLRGH